MSIVSDLEGVRDALIKAIADDEAELRRKRFRLEHVMKALDDQVEEKSARDRAEASEGSRENGEEKVIRLLNSKDGRIVGYTNKQMADLLGLNYPYVRNITSHLAHKAEPPLIVKERHPTPEGMQSFNRWVGG